MGYENNRPKMSKEERAKQFLPFSAVRGLEEALERKRQELFVETQPILCFDAEVEIDETLRSISRGDEVEIEYFDGVKNKTKRGIVDNLRREMCDIILGGEYISFSSIGKIRVLDKKIKEPSHNVF